LEKYISPEPNSGCWLWTGAVDLDGYGVAWASKTTKRAHRVIFEGARGAIPPGLHLDHLCRNTSCVNPGHLEPVTPRENTMRGVTPAAANAKKTHCRNGHPFDEANVYWFGNERRCRACGLAATLRYQRKKKQAST
jgi:hypothetical protein